MTEANQPQCSPGSTDGSEPPLSGKAHAIIDDDSPQRMQSTYAMKFRRSASRSVESVTTVTHYDLEHQGEIVSKLPVAVRLIGTIFAFLAMVCTWESIDHLVLYLFPNSAWQLWAYVGLMIVAMVCIQLSKKLVENDWNELGSFSFTLSSLGCAAGGWGFTVAIVRLYFKKEAHWALWTIGAVVFLIGSFVYMVVTKHNALLDVASCVTSLGLLDDHMSHSQEEEEKVKTVGKDDEEEKKQYGTLG